MNIIFPIHTHPHTRKTLLNEMNFPLLSFLSGKVSAQLIIKVVKIGIEHIQPFNVNFPSSVPEFVLSFHHTPASQTPRFVWCVFAKSAKSFFLLIFYFFYYFPLCECELSASFCPKSCWKMPFSIGHIVLTHRSCRLTI